MNKDKFLKELEKKLSVLNEKERKDIIDEYKSTIEEKIKNGESEEKAIEDFGNIDELAKEILEAYKIDPKYKQNDFNNLIKDGENIIKECADNLAKGTKDIVENFKNNNEEINLSLVFEILIKIFLTIIFLGLLRIPFMIFTSISNGIFSALFSPIDIVIKAFWSLFLTVIYLILVVLIVSKIFRQYFVKKETDSKEEINKKADTKTKTSNIKLEKKDEVKKNTIDNQIITIVMTLIKIFVIIFILIPLIGMNICFISLTTISIYYWIKGINLLGLTLLFTGISMVSIWFTHLIKNVLENKRVKAHLLIIGIISIISGGFLFGHMITNIDYINEAPQINNSQIMTNVYEIDKKVYIDYPGGSEINKTVDESIPDNTFKIQIKYDKDLYSINISENREYTFDEEDCIEDKLCQVYNYYNINYNGDIKEVKPLYNMFINNLKQNKVYNYSKMFNPEIEIYANEKTMESIEIG